MPGYYSRPARLGRQVRQLLLPRRCPYCREVLGTLLRCEACMTRLEELPPLLLLLPYLLLAGGALAVSFAVSCGIMAEKDC